MEKHNWKDRFEFLTKKDKKLYKVVSYTEENGKEIWEVHGPMPTSFPGTASNHPLSSQLIKEVKKEIEEKFGLVKYL